MDLLTLREELETLLVDDLGVYTLANGITTPAISVRSTGELSPANTRVSGLECVLDKQPELPQILQYEHTSPFRIFTLYLINWSGGDLTPIAEKLLRGFPAAVTAQLRPQRVPEGTGPQSQMRITLKFNPEAEQ